jgi:histidinol-phosphate aminotransferase
MYDLPEKIKKLAPYEPLEPSLLIGKIRLDANESFMRFPPEAIAEAVLTYGELINRYPDPYASSVLNVFGELYGVSPNNVTAGNGSDELISIITACLLSRGDKVLCFSPDFSMYFFYPHLYELDLVIQQKNYKMLIDIPAAIEKINNENISAVMFSNPCNPTSLGINADKIKKLITDTKALVILDEAYMDFWDESQTLLNFATEHENLIVLKTCSKSMALAGIRLGFAVASCKLTNVLRAAKSPYNVNLLTQAVGEYALLNKSRMKTMAGEISRLTKGLKDSVNNLKIPEFTRIYESATNFLFIEIKDEDKAAKIFEYLFENGIVIRKLGKYLRITCGSPEENAVLIERLESYKEKP